MIKSIQPCLFVATFVPRLPHEVVNLYKETYVLLRGPKYQMGEQIIHIVPELDNGNRPIHLLLLLR